VLRGGRKSELFSSKGDEPSKVLFPPLGTDLWIEQVCGISHSLLQFDRIHT
jgi:hypothetical protein